MKVTALLFFMFLPFTIHAAEKSEFRTFKSADGREMEACLTLVSTDDVFIERRDGLATKVDIHIFSETDQAFIRQWGREQALKDDGVEVRFKGDISDKTGFENNRGGILRKTWKQGYEIVVSNNTYKDIENVRIEYLVLKFEDALAAQKRSEGVIKRLKDKTSIKRIKAREDATAQTKKIPMLETKLAHGYVWADGGKDDSEDEIRGIWVRVYVDDLLVCEVSKPENMSQKEVW